MNTVRSHDLASLLRTGRVSSDPEVRAALIALSKEVRNRLDSGSGESRDFFVSAADSVGRIKGAAHRGLRADCLIDCCKYFFLCGDSVAALEAARKAVALASSSKDLPKERIALNTLGILYTDTANFAEAVECFSQTLDLVRQLSLRGAESTTWLNLGVALMYMSRYHEAIECLDRASMCSQGTDYGAVLARKVAHNESLCWYHLGELKFARQRAEFSILGDGDPKDNDALFVRLTREHNYVQILLDAGEFAVARQRMAVVSTLANDSSLPRTAAVFGLIRGLVESYCGDFSKGTSDLEHLLTEAPAPVRRDALVALTRAYERAGNHAKALEYLQELLEVHQTMRQQSALLHIANVGTGARSRLHGQLDLAPMKVRHSRLRAAVAEERGMRTQLEMLERLAITADLRDDPSGKHGFRVGRMSSLLAAELGWNEQDCLAVELAARLHDVGKTGIPDRVVLSSEVLQRDERRLMNTHAEIGAELLAKSNVPQIQLAEEIARNHHERWDGSGYPNGIAGRRIPLSARIVALADVFDAMTHGRPYEHALSIEDALAEIGRLSGKHFDPSITEKFLVLIPRLVQKHGDLDSYLGEASRKSPFFVARGRIQRLLDDAQSGS